MTDVLNEKGEVIGHKDPIGPEGEQGCASKVDDILSQGAAWTPAAGADKGKVEDLLDPNFFDSLEIDEAAIEAKRDGGGEAFEPSNNCEGGGCII